MERSVWLDFQGWLLVVEIPDVQQCLPGCESGPLAGMLNPEPRGLGDSSRPGHPSSPGRPTEPWRSPDRSARPSTPALVNGRTRPGPGALRPAPPTVPVRLPPGRPGPPRASDPGGPGRPGRKLAGLEEPTRGRCLRTGPAARGPGLALAPGRARRGPLLQRSGSPPGRLRSPRSPGRTLRAGGPGPPRPAQGPHGPGTPHGGSGARPTSGFATPGR